MQQTQRRKRRRGPLWREAVDGWLFILPWLLGFLCFTAGPMVASAVLSFWEWEILTPPNWVGLANFRQMAGDPLFRLALYNTAYYTFLGVPLYLIGALGSALLLNLPLRGIAIYRTLFFLPSLTPAVANALLWVWIFSPDFGLANYLLGMIGAPPQKWLFDVNLAKPALILMGLWGIGSQMIVFLGGLQGIPQTLYEAASIDGANEWRRFWNITLPMLSPTIFFNLVIGIIGSFQVFTTAYIATQGGPQNATLFYVLYLWRNGFDYFKMGYASALAWVLLLIILLLTLIQFRLARRLVYYEFEETG
ncbi:MAG: sugar ABC transporter permease [Caldilinea sp. CFX5]|nr:sugar ABC transporter permease [Caldilinea sp. CFX5]